MLVDLFRTEKKNPDKKGFRPQPRVRFFPQYWISWEALEVFLQYFLNNAPPP